MDLDNYTPEQLEAILDYIKLIQTELQFEVERIEHSEGSERIKRNYISGIIAASDSIEIHRIEIETYME